jgi:hypothetical protein
MTWSPDTLAKIKRLQAQDPAWGDAFARACLAALNKATLADKARMTPAAVEAEEARRGKYLEDST